MTDEELTEEEMNQYGDMIITMFSLLKQAQNFCFDNCEPKTAAHTEFYSELQHLGEWFCYLVKGYNVNPTSKNDPDWVVLRDKLRQIELGKIKTESTTRGH